MKTTIQIKGTDCKSCKALIEDVCKDIPGIKSCNVDFKTGKTVVEYESDVLDWKRFKKEVDALGKYEVVLK
ncbi:MAG: heavy metal-associated domain-containing protein [Nanoarchaeota archaeon]